jgi:single-strand DNA-binding protein
MSNATNNANLIGRLAADPKVFPNQDGSKKVLITVYVDRAYRTAEGKTISDQISVEAFVNNKVDGIGPFAFAHGGDLVGLSTHIEQLPYLKDGKLVYPGAKVVIDDIKFLESRGTTQARLAKRSVAAAEPTEGAAAEAAPAADATADSSAYDNDAPFATAGA